MIALKKYLDHYAIELNIPWEGQSFDRVVVLPTFGEDVKDVKEVLKSLQTAAEFLQKNALAILVVNQRKNAKDTYKALNRELLEYFQCHGKTSVLVKADFLSTLVVNYTFPDLEFSEKEGVGLARKIGCDLAAKLIFQNKILSPWIYTTDIDAKVAKDYFNEENLDQNTALKFFPFRHSFEKSDGEALLLYDIWLRYYTLSLRKIGSPFSYSTLGSTFCIEASAYGKVRGFPNRLAAEDFHLASKLSKVGKLQYSNLSPIQLMGRKSDRVPFGTGVGTEKYSKHLEANEKIEFIHPKCFALLEKFQADAVEYLKLPKQAPPYIPKEIDETLGLSEIIKTALSTRPHTKDRVLHFYTAFDALKTLRFIHLAEQFYYPKISFSKALFLLDMEYDTQTKTLIEIAEKMAQDEERPHLFTFYS